MVKQKANRPKIGVALQKIVGDRRITSVAEIGVLRAATSFYLLDTFPSINKYYAIDMWKLYPDFKKVMKASRFKQFKDGLDFENMYKTVVKNGKKYGDRLNIMRMSSKDAASKVEDLSLDLVFIDANHAYEYVKEDIALWSPKVKKGGILSGHDFGKAGPRGNFGVTEAVKELIPSFKLRGSIWYTVKD